MTALTRYSLLSHNQVFSPFHSLSGSSVQQSDTTTKVCQPFQRDAQKLSAPSVKNGLWKHSRNWWTGTTLKNVLLNTNCLYFSAYIPISSKTFFLMQLVSILCKNSIKYKKLMIFPWFFIKCRICFQFSTNCFKFWKIC